MSKNTKQHKNHVFGETRYLTIWLIFPGDNERWVDQVMFNQPVDNFVKGLSKLDLTVKHDLVTKGEAKFKDKNGMIFLYKIENEKRDRVWGLNKQ